MSWNVKPILKLHWPSEIDHKPLCGLRCDLVYGISYAKDPSGITCSFCRAIKTSRQQEKK